MNLELLNQAGSETDAQRNLILSALDTLVQNAHIADYQEEMDVSVLQSLLVDRLNASVGAPRRQDIAGGITFADMRYLRGIPFKAIVLLGMSNESFPRARRAPGFDLMTANPRFGDRSMRATIVAAKRMAVSA